MLPLLLPCLPSSSCAMAHANWSSANLPAWPSNCGRTVQRPAVATCKATCVTCICSRPSPMVLSVCTKARAHSGFASEVLPARPSPTRHSCVKMNGRPLLLRTFQSSGVLLRYVTILENVPTAGFVAVHSASNGELVAVCATLCHAWHV